AILVRRGRIVEHRVLRLCLLPERRWMHAVAVAERNGPREAVWMANLHLTVHKPAAATREAHSAAEAVLHWADGWPAVLGGDFNLPAPSLPGLEQAGGHGVDHILASGLRAVGESEVLVRGLLSDHPPVLVELERVPRA
ncbi:MAG TPA: endonuclease/exonuclease/phosphatase family protein, partial [Solirubrobacteraceae bacterium]